MPIIEQAGGYASTGRERILDLIPHSLHQRVPLIFGACDEIERIAAYHREHNLAATMGQHSYWGTRGPLSVDMRLEARRLWDMSAKHPVIAITGSSGAGTTSVMRTFEQIFRREGVKAAFVEGDSFHRYDRAEMKRKMSEKVWNRAASASVTSGRKPICSRSSRHCSGTTVRGGRGRGAEIPAR